MSTRPAPEALLRSSEWTGVELKASKSALPKSVFETVSAFAKTRGGWIVLGVTQDGERFEVSGVDEPDKVHNDYLSVLHAGQKVSHDVDVSEHRYEHDGKVVLAFQVAENPRPCKRDGDIRRTFLRKRGGDYLETLGAGALLRRLRDRELLALHPAGPNSYYELGPKARVPVDAQGLEADRPGAERDRPELTAERPESEADRPELPPDLAAAVTALGTRPRHGPLRDVIASKCRWRPLKPAELGSILGIRADNLAKRHLSEMVAEGHLRRLFPGEPSHPNQAYAAASDDDEQSPT